MPDRSDAQVGPGDSVVCKLNSGQPRTQSGRMKGKSRLELSVQKDEDNGSSVDSSSGVAPGTTHCVPTTSLQRKLGQFGGSAGNSNESEWIPETEEKMPMKD